MKTAFTFKRWYWADPYEKQPPQWWSNFLRDTNGTHEAFTELRKIANVRQKMNGDYRVVFNTPSDLTMFVLRWS